MSNIGHVTPPIRPFDALRPVFARAFEYPQGYQGNSHRHRLAQLVYPVRGVVSVDTEQGCWVVTRLRAVSIPPWTEHRVTSHGNASIRSIFVNPDAHPRLLTELEAVEVTELLHELIREAGRHYVDFDEASVPATVIDLIVALVPSMRRSQTSIWLPRLEHPRLQPIAERFAAAAGCRDGIEAWADRLAVSPRHLARLFKAHTGITFQRWRALFLVQAAMKALAAGDSVTTVALDLGFSSTSAFIEMFKRETGRTPGSFKRPGIG